MVRMSLPVNNIYGVPVETISFLECSEGRALQGACKTHFWVEANTPNESERNLRSLPAFEDNFNKLSVEKRKGLRPFRLREGNVEQVRCCEKRFKNRDGEYTCGKPIHDIEGNPERNDDSVNMNGEYGFCYIEGFDIPEDLGCPYEEGRYIFVA